MVTEGEEEEFITSGNWRGKHNSLSRGAGADQPLCCVVLLNRDWGDPFPVIRPNGYCKFLQYDSK